MDFKSADNSFEKKLPYFENRAMHFDNARYLADEAGWDTDDSEEGNRKDDMTKMMEGDW